MTGHPVTGYGMTAPDDGPREAEVRMRGGEMIESRSGRDLGVGLEQGYLLDIPNALSEPGAEER